MKKIISFSILSALLGAGCISCEKDKTNDANNSDSSKGYVTGQVTNTQGQPVANAQVYISSDVWFNSGSQTTSDANGKYKIKIPSINSLRAYARTLVTYNNKQYLVSFEPDHPQSFTSEDAVTCNFKWKLTGAVPGSSAPDDYYGGLVTIYASSSNLPFPAGDLAAQGNVIFTFEPQGTLIDGSAGKTVTAHAGPPNYSYIYDIPIGKYKVSATYLGQALKIRDNSQNSNDTFGASKVLDFTMEGSNTNGGPIRMYLEFSK